MLAGVDIATGEIKITANFSTNGTADTTHTQSYVPLPPTQGPELKAYVTSLRAYYENLDQEVPPMTSTSAGAPAPT
jgi:hypothetical protein